MDVEINNIKVWKSPVTAGLVQSVWWDLVAIYDKATQCRTGQPGCTQAGWDDVKRDLQTIVTRRGKKSGILLAIDFFQQVNANIFNLSVLQNATGNISSLTTSSLSDKVGGNMSARKIVKDALSATGDSCRLYQQEIIKLLKTSSRPLQRIVVNRLLKSYTGRRSNVVTLDTLGWKENSARVKVYMGGSPKIYIDLPEKYYITNQMNLTEVDYVTILSGTLFECGNVVEKSDTVSGDTRCEYETRVTLDNAIRVLNIALHGGIISQQDWRNLMAFVIGMQFDVKTGQYNFQRALEYFNKTPHNVSDQTLRQVSSQIY